MIAYTGACIIYFVSDMHNKIDYDGDTFVKSIFPLKKGSKDEPADESHTPLFKLITCCYFSLTTLSTIGYGDLCPKSDTEMIIVSLFMLVGVAVFSFIMGSFIEIISSLNSNGVEEKTFELHNWMTLLTRFRENRPLPNSLYRQINSHFKYYWSNNRLAEIRENESFIKAMPKSIKHGIVVHYLFDDIFYNFRFFFNPQKYKDSKFLNDVAYGLKPRRFSDETEECVIYDEEEEVLEMYFIV